MAGPATWGGRKLVAEIETGNVSVEVLGKSVVGVVELAKKTGLFDDYVVRPERSIEDPDRLGLITAIVAGSIVLLKNDNNTLLLTTNASVAVISHLSTDPSIGGDGSAKLLAQHIISPRCGLESRWIKCRCAPGVPVFGVLRHAEEGSVTEVQLRWFNSSVVGDNLAHEQTITQPEYMIKEAWPSYLNRQYCTSMSFNLTPTSSSDHTFSVITTGKADVFINGNNVFHRPQEPGLLPEMISVSERTYQILRRTGSRGN
ncbi:uncharacterized protein FTOL_05201 [Fusarium torulosum]|uniref:beta-glucosidase n=1 Tax=Fusarium torulosum TaxID=33205 RepID=A0AAE8M7A2_9HYPO|nr:uncharacterized protein FTOL_05201 [Fusarium torulosum]